MPTARITLTVVHGDLPEKEYVFEEPTRCIIGRAEDCDIQVPANYQHAVVSRHHCCLEMEPPAIRVHDLGSRNGTYVNGGNIGQHPGIWRLRKRTSASSRSMNSRTETSSE